MNIEEIRTYCLEKPLANESFPFGDQTLVFKVHDKIFALLGLEPPFSINLKCDPDRAIEFRETYPDVIIPDYGRELTFYHRGTGSAVPQSGQERIPV